MGKSAQIGLHVWLPEAMEGPTPVSALIHAATMVTAGIFLIIRCSVLFEYSYVTLHFILIVGVFTAFFASTVGLVQFDIKKVIAYSTCSQLGYMTFICGLSSYNISFFHLVNHAFFKALLFLGAGSVIHAMSGDQDMRRYGSLSKILPLTYSIFIIGSLALAGFPFLSGFFSKDLILEVTFTTFNFYSTFTYWFSVTAAGFTAFYSVRVLCLSFLVPTNSYKRYFQYASEPLLLMVIPLVILAVFSIFSGYILKDLFVGYGSNF